MSLPPLGDLGPSDEDIKRAAYLPQDSESHWHISGIETAEWSMRRLGEAAEKLRKLAVRRLAWLEELDEWLGRERKAPQRTIDYFEAELKAYALALREADPDAKTLRLPSGEVATRSSSDRVVVTDQSALLAWAKANRPDLVVTLENVSPSGLKEVAKAADGVVVDGETGEVIPGVEVDPGGVSATVKPKAVES